MGRESGGSKAEGGKKREGRGRGSTDRGAGSVAAKGDGASSLYSVEAAVLGFDPAEFTDGGAWHAPDTFKCLVYSSVAGRVFCRALVRLVGVGQLRAWG
jgi:hypothetical protein